MVAIFVAASCSSLRKLSEYPDVTAELTEELALQDDGTVPMSYDVTIPAEYRSLHTGVLIYPCVQSADSSVVVKLDSVAVDGVFNETFNDRMDVYQDKLSDGISIRYAYAPKGEPTVVALCDTLAYEPWMADATVEIDLWAESYGERTPIGHVSFPLSIILPEPEVAEPEPVFEEFSDTTALGKSRFMIGSAELESLDEDFRNAVKVALSREKIVKYSVEIEASCSPEAGEEFNNSLAQARADRLAELLENEGVARGSMTLVPVGINWNMLYSWLAANGEEKLVETLKSEEDALQRYRNFRDGNYLVWKQARQELFPDMRYSRAIINVTTLKQTN